MSERKELIEWIEENEEISFPIMEAIWISRWNKGKTALKAVLTPIEAEKMCKDIVEKLDEAGYEIIKKKSK
jgi:hypothetical protein